jgi:predicted Zn-dependent peptidase
MMNYLIIILLLTGAVMGKSSLPKYYEENLENGLKVVVIPQKNGSGVISTDIFYRVGSRNEVMGKSGIAHMLEHLNFKSTKNLKAGEFDEIVKGYGGVNNASTGFDYTHYFIKSSASNLEHSLHLFAELMENLALKDEEFQPERDVVAEERRWRTENNPLGYLYFELFNTAYKYHPYHWTPIGFMDDIQNWSIGDIQAFHSAFYQPKNAIVVVAGDIDEKRVFESVKKEFAHIKNGVDTPKVHTVEPKQNGERRAIVHKASETDMVAIVYHIPNFQHEDQAALSVISEILSGGKSSRLQKRLVDELKLTNQLYAYNMESIDPGVFLFMGVCNPGVKAKKVEQEILDIINEIKQKPVSKGELEKVMTNIRSDFIYELESSSEIANLFGSFLAKGDINALLNYEANMGKVDAHKVQEVAKRYFQKENSTTVILKQETMKK